MALFSFSKAFSAPEPPSQAKAAIQQIDQERMEQMMQETMIQGGLTDTAGAEESQNETEEPQSEPEMA